MQNIFFLFVILIAVFIQEPKYIRELLMLIAAGGSYFLTKKEIHQQNNFSFIPLKEVAILFLCIFITMVPALDWIEVHAVSIGLSLPGHYYWATGGLSSVLDNAPTYVNFLHAAIGLKVSPDAIAHLQAFIAARGNDITGLAPDLQRTMDVLRTYHLTIVNAGLVPVDDIKISYLIANADSYLKAISIGAVFFGALTYIGNGPNMLVKSIAEHHHAKCPSFHEYVLKYSLPILIPIFLIVWWVFF